MLFLFLHLSPTPNPLESMYRCMLYVVPILGGLFVRSWRKDPRVCKSETACHLIPVTFCPGWRLLAFMLYSRSPVTTSDPLQTGWTRLHTKYTPTANGRGPVVCPIFCSVQHLVIMMLSMAAHRNVHEYVKWCKLSFLSNLLVDV